MALECQVCGKPAAGEGTVEGTRVPLCDRDSAYSGNFSFFKDFVETMQAKAEKARPSYSLPLQHAPAKPKSEDSGELAEDYAKRIMQARSKLGLSRKELAQKIFIQEKELEGFEQSKYKPSGTIVKKLEFALGVKLTEE